MHNQTDWFPVERLHQPIVITIKPYEKFEINFPRASLSGLLLFVVVFLILILVSTYIKTCLRCRRAIVKPKAGKEPPVAPYWFPYLGHTLSLLLDMDNLFSSVLDTVKKGVPVNVRVLLNDVYVITGAENISTIFRNEAYSFPSDVAPIASLGNIFALPKPALKVYIADTSGIKREPAPWSDVEPHRRIRYLTFKATTLALTGTGLDQMNHRFALNLADSIHKMGYTSEWTESPDLCQFLRTPVFQAAVDSMFGPHLLSLSPHLAHDFWVMDQRVQQLLKCFPGWMIPEASKARQRCLGAMKKWHAFTSEHLDDTKVGEESSYEPLQRSVYIRQMMKHFSALEEMSLDAKASNSLGMLFAMIGNSMPAINWSLLEIFQSPTLLARVRAEVATTVLPPLTTTSPPTPEFDLARLLKLPLLQSIYTEILRLHIAIFHIRSVRHSDYHLGDWLLREGSKILISSRPAHLDPTAFNTGTAEEPHPIHEFWADRFLVPTSSTPGNQELKFSLDGCNGSWIPYGGGQRICPGRHFAKAEIFLAMAFFVTVFDIELQVPKGWKAEEDGARLGMGGLNIKGKIPMRVRRRRLGREL